MVPRVKLKIKFYLFLILVSIFSLGFVKHESKFYIIPYLKNEYLIPQSSKNLVDSLLKIHLEYYKTNNIANYRIAIFASKSIEESHPEKIAKKRIKNIKNYVLKQYPFLQSNVSARFSNSIIYSEKEKYSVNIVFVPELPF